MLNARTMLVRNVEKSGREIACTSLSLSLLGLFTLHIERAHKVSIDLQCDRGTYARQNLPFKPPSVYAATPPVKFKHDTFAWMRFWR